MFENMSDKFVSLLFSFFFSQFLLHWENRIHQITHFYYTYTIFILYNGNTYTIYNHIHIHTYNFYIGYIGTLPYQRYRNWKHARWMYFFYICRFFLLFLWFGFLDIQHNNNSMFSHNIIICALPSYRYNMMIW